MPVTAAYPGLTERSAPRPDGVGFAETYQKIVSAAAWLFVASASISLIEPSPYDFAFFLALPLWLFGGFTVHRSFALLYFLLAGYAILGYLAVIPYWNERDSVLFEHQSTYLMMTGLFYALFVGERTITRGELILNAYAFGAFVAATCAILGYFNVEGLGELFSMYGRASGTFKDPNVLGSYLILGELHLMQNLLLGRARAPWRALLALLVLMAAIFLSFSRGSWGATMISTLLMIGSAYATTRSARMRGRIATFTGIALLLGVLVILGLLSNPSTHDFFLQRAALSQDYDDGETGRFGNQLRSLPMLLERFAGFGPLRFRLFFGLDPHNSYVGAFADGGWLGGLLNIYIVCLTTFIGFRLMLKTSPYQRLAQVFFPALFVSYLQAFQIDIDHWRHVYIMLGSVWGLEAARQKWVANTARATLYGVLAVSKSSASPSVV